MLRSVNLTQSVLYDLMRKAVRRYVTLNSWSSRTATRVCRRKSGNFNALVNATWTASRPQTATILAGIQVWRFVPRKGSYCEQERYVREMRLNRRISGEDCLRVSSVYGVALHQALELASMNAQQLGGIADVASSLVQSLDDFLSLH